MARDPGADGIDVTIHLCVIGGFVTGYITVNEESDYEQHNHSDDYRYAETGTAGARGCAPKVPFGCRQGFSTGVSLLRLSSRALRRLFHTLIAAFQKSFDSLFRIADGSRQLDFGEIMRIEALNVTLVRARDRLLSLNHLEIVRDPGRKAVLRLTQSLFGQIHRAASHLDLLCRGAQIEQGAPDFVVDAAAEIAKLRASLVELGVGFQDVAVDPASRKNWNRKTGVDLPRPVRVPPSSRPPLRRGTARRR